MGYCFSTYGIVALLSYLLGGSLADKFKPHYLIAVSLWLTALGGLALSTIPSFTGVCIIYGFWGFSTIFLFWSALIKSSRIWGGTNGQGKSFGLLEGGRGLVGAGFGFLGVLIFSTIAGESADDFILPQKIEIFKSVILYASLFVALIGVFVFFGLRVDKTAFPKEKNPISYYLKCLKLPAIWLLMLIVLCAYVGYKSTDYFAQFATEVMNYKEMQASNLSSSLLLVRAASALIIGFVADKFGSLKILILSFVIMILGGALMASGWMHPSFNVFFILSIVFAGIGVYTLRTLYYAVMSEGNIPLIYTGTAVGLIAVIGYTPEIFFGPLSGKLLDNNPGETGHQLIFGIMTAFGIVGLICAIVYNKFCTKADRSS